MALNLSLVADINPGAGNGLTAGVAPGFTNLFGELYFQADDGTGTFGVELYKYDPEADAVTLVADINPGAGPSNPSDLAVFNGELYFAADDGGGNGVELYKYDPEADAVTLVADINPGLLNGNPSDLAVFNGELYFAADDGITGVELYKYDPEANAVTLVADINPGALGGNPSDLAVFNGELYFAADDGTGTFGVELYKYDPEADAVTLVADINPGPPNSNPSDLAVFNGELYFAADDGTGTIGTELYKYNSATNAVTLVADIWAGATSSNPSDLAVFQGELYFTADNGENSTEVYKYSPDTDQATLVENIRPLGGGSNPSDLTVFQGELYLSADDGTATIGQELYKLTPDPFDGRFGAAERAPIGEDGDNFTPGNGGWTSQSEFPRTLADVNGDGRADIIGFGANSVFVSLSEGDGSFGQAQAVLDSFTPGNGGWTNQGQFPRTAADVNGDGRADLIGFGANSVFVSLSEEDGSFGQAQAVLDNFTLGNGGWTNQNDFYRTVGDFNGDGRADLMGFGLESVFVSYSQEDGTFTPAQAVLNNFSSGNGGWTTQNEFPRMVGDFNGDGRDDIIGFGSQSVFLSLSQEDGTFTPAQVAAIGTGDNYTVNNGGWTGQNVFRRTVADINGDSRDDIIGFGSENIFYSLSEGDGSFTEAEILSLDGAGSFTVGSGGWTSQDLFPRFMEDINGDSQADIVGFGSESVFTALA